MKFSVGLGMFSVLSGCGRPVIQPEVVGKYVADYEAAKEELTLHSDGRFTQQVTIKSTSQVLTTNGTWTFDAADQRLTFHESFLIVLDGFGQPKKQPETGTAILPVVNRFGNVHIGYEPIIEYKKQPGS